MNIIARPACGLLVATLVALATGCSVDPSVELAAARAAFDRDDLPAAAIHLSNVLAVEGNNATARFMRGQIALLDGDAARARDELERAVELDATNQHAKILLADAHLQLQEPGDALERLDGVTEDARTPEYWVLRAEASVGREELQAAAESLARAVPDTSRALVVRARMADMTGDVARAEALFTEAVADAEDERRRADALAARASHHVAHRALEAAASDLTEAAAAYGERNMGVKEIGARTTLVQLQIALNRLEDAAQTAQRLEALSPGTPAANYAEAVVAYEAGRFDEAATRLQRLTNDVPDNALFATLLGAAHLAKGEVFQAEQQLQRAIAIAPADLAAHKLLAETRLRQQRPEAALDALRPLAHITGDPQVNALFGIASFQAGDIDEGIGYLEQAAASSPENQALQLQLARAYLAAGRGGDAGRVLATLSAGEQGLSAHLTLLLSHLVGGNTAEGRASAALLAAEYPEEPRAHTAAAVYYQLVGDDRSALERAAEAMRIDPEFVPARLVLAELTARDGRVNEAQKHLDSVLAIEPDNTAALNASAQLASLRGDHAAAEALRLRVVEKTPSVLNRLALARTRLLRGDLDGAQREIDAASQGSADDPLIIAERGILALVRGRPNEAISLLRRASVALPARVDIALGLAQAQIAAADPSAARDTLRDAVARAPQSLPVRAALGAAELQAGNVDAALVIAKALEVEFPRQAAGHLLEADVRLAQRRYSAAATSFEQAYELSPNLSVLTRWGLALELDGRRVEIEPPLRAWVESHAGEVTSRLLLASVLESAARNTEALAQYEDVLALDPDNVAALNNGAWLRQQLGVADALTLAERAHGLAPSSAAVLDTLGWILTLSGRVAEGHDHLKGAVALAPDAPDLRYHLAFALAELGDIEAAKGILETLLADGRPFATRDDAEALKKSL